VAVQWDMAWLAALGVDDLQRGCVRVEVAHFQPDQLDTSKNLAFPSPI
jgi:hypothetical protein